jgi:hypothetical protein
VFDANGEKLHEGKGGLDLLDGSAWRRTSGVPAFRFLPRADPSSTAQYLRDGIAAAFLPFLPPAGRRIRKPPVIARDTAAVFGTSR